MSDKDTIFFQRRMTHPWEGKTWEFVRLEFSRLDRILQRFNMVYGISRFTPIGHSLLGWHLDLETTYKNIEAGEKRLKEMYERRCRLGGILGRRYGLIIN